LRDKAGDAILLHAKDARHCEQHADTLLYSDFSVPEAQNVAVTVRIAPNDGEAAVWVSVDPGSDALCPEWVDVLPLTLPPLVGTAPGGGRILFPYNEGVLVSDANQRQSDIFPSMEPEYPSLGSYAVFPNMISSQLLAYLWEDAGLYLAVHDATRAPKGIDFAPDGDGVTLRFRMFCGCRMGECYHMPAPLTLARCESRWEDAAERYRTWFGSHLPPRVAKVADNPALPDWYTQLPLVVTYPVRGIHDMDEMKPNALYPYTNALPLLDELRHATSSRLLVLLMHWEGTAPWAPPYVWPPYGGEEGFHAMRDALHAQGHLFGVYCSGFGYTIQSNLNEYNMEKEYAERGLEAGMCAGPDGRVAISRICTGQRKGYDICPASEVGHDILAKAYEPLFESGIDYAQILDQNHGGGQYFCYSREHGHPPVPGAWMTENMQSMLTEWNGKAGNMLLGCESAAAEPFMGNLLMSDNRFELNYHIGVPVPLYAYLYHEYLRNFMGNQVSCPFGNDQDTLCYRVGYSFAAGDLMTLVLTPDGQLMTNWGNHDFSRLPDREKALDLVENLCRFYREGAGKYLHNGKMIPAKPVACGQKAFFMEWYGRDCTIPSVYTTAWLADDGTKAQIFVNPGDVPETVTVDGREITVPARDAVMIEI
jgi:hypothetical protein